MHCNGDDDDDIGNDDCYKIFIADHRFRYSLLYSVLGFFATTLLEPYSKSKKATRRRCLLFSAHVKIESVALNSLEVWPIGSPTETKLSCILTSCSSTISKVGNLSFH